MARQQKFYLVLKRADGKESEELGLRSKDLGEFLRLLDDVFSSTIKTNLGDDCGGLRILAISKGSLVVECDEKKPQRSAFDATVSWLLGKNSSLPSVAQKKIYAIRDFNAIHNTSLEFRKTKKGPAMATILASDKSMITQKPQIVRTRITLYGKIVEISGVSKIRATIAPLNYTGQTSFSVTDSEARRLGANFGKVIAVEGEASIAIPSRIITEFVKFCIVEFEDRSASDAFAIIRKKYGSHFSAIENITDFVAQQRG